MTHRTDKNTANASDRTIRNPMLYPFELRAHNNNCNQQDTAKSNYFQPFPNRPTCEQVEAITGALAPKETPERREQLERVAEIWFSRGYAGWWVLFSVAVVVFGAYIYHQSKPNTFRYYAPADKFQILKRYPDGFRYDFRWIHAENGKVTVRPIYGHFCEGFMPRFSAGETLTFLGYQDVGSCWLIEGQGLGYDFQKDRDGHVSLAPNCHRGERIVECEPVLNEAVFPEDK